ncbi:hypothetical protein KJ708_03170 [bacterium]|nr:hypothetical protein [bacterium]MBU1918082.1 hypothetical protein [bacterium]
MARPQGFDHFCDYLKGLENHYVIIGGGAASILLEEEELTFRATKDVDLVVLSRSDELNKRILSYVKKGKYQKQESTTVVPRYYRFTKPKDQSCPQVIEIFSRNELELDLKEGQHIIPLQSKYAERLSAILLDDEYFNLIRDNLLLSETGIPYINSVANICLKAKAYREMTERKKAGNKDVDEKDIQKHLKDIWRLAAVLPNTSTVKLSSAVFKDIKKAIEQLDQLTEKQFKQVMKNIPGQNYSSTMNLLNSVFLSR